MIRFLIFLLISNPIFAQELVLGEETINEVTIAVEDESVVDLPHGMEETSVVDSTRMVEESSLEQKIEVLNYSGGDVSDSLPNQKKFGVNFRYLGVLSQVGVEARVYRQFSMGIHYGRYNGKVAGTDKLGLIPDLQNLNLSLNAYLGREKLAFTNGLVIRFGVHANRQKKNDLVQSIQVDGKDIIRPGETKIGTLLGVGYHYQHKNVFASLGIEYLKLGPLKNLVPIAATVGVAF